MGFFLRNVSSRTYSMGYQRSKKKMKKHTIWDFFPRIFSMNRIKIHLCLHSIFFSITSYSLIDFMYSDACRRFSEQTKIGPRAKKKYPPCLPQSSEKANISTEIFLTQIHCVWLVTMIYAEKFSHRKQSDFECVHLYLINAFLQQVEILIKSLQRVKN